MGEARHKKWVDLRVESLVKQFLCFVTMKDVLDLGIGGSLAYEPARLRVAEYVVTALIDASIIKRNATSCVTWPKKRPSIEERRELWEAGQALIALKAKERDNHYAMHVANGAALDDLAWNYGLTRRSGEADASLRNRCVTFWRG